MSLRKASYFLVFNIQLLQNVCPIINCSSHIWGDKPYSYNHAVQNGVMEFLLGVGRYTPHVAVSGGMGPIVNRWRSVFDNIFEMFI